MTWTPKVGDRVRAKVDLIDRSINGKQIVCANKGDALVIKNILTISKWGILEIVVSPEKYSNEEFGAAPDQIEPIED